MKKILSIVLAVTLIFSLVACKKAEKNENLTLGQALLEEFKTIAKNEKDPLKIADALITSDKIEFMAMSMEVEPGYLMGFSADEIKGFEKAASFAPAINTIPFLGYIFSLSDGADVNEFMTMLSDNADLRWNICTSADELTVENEGNIVFFLMSTNASEEAESEEPMGDPIDDVMADENEVVDDKSDEVAVTDPLPEEAPKAEEPQTLTLGKTLLKDFKAIVAAGETNGEAIANKLMASELIEFMPMVAEMPQGYFQGLRLEEVTGFEKAYFFGPSIGTIPFLGYIFSLPEGADVTTFMADLSSNADLRWNICTSADELIVERAGNLVFFLMSPLSMESAE